MKYLDETEFNLISQALRCLESHMREKGEFLGNSNLVKDYLKMQLAHEKNEIFGILFLDSQNRMLAFEKLFFGTINETSVYPRVVVQKVLDHNAAKVILAHNHPSGKSEPSNADEMMTKQLAKILNIVDVQILDHIIVAHQNTFSFAESGLM